MHDVVVACLAYEVAIVVDAQFPVLAAEHASVLHRLEPAQGEICGVDSVDHDIHIDAFAKSGTVLP